jgi:hypothetical protein
MENTIKKKPIKVFQCGSVKAAIWVDSKVLNNAMVELHSIKFNRCYKEDEEWKYTNTFNAEDLPKLSVVAMEAYKFIRLQSSEQNNES